MMSEISFSKFVKAEWKQLLWLTAVQGVLYVLMVPFRILMVFSISEERDLELLCSNIGMGRFENVLVILAAGAGCALIAFAYVHSAVKLDLYHSLPVRREKLFAAKYLASALTFALTYGMALVLGVLVGMLYGAGSWALVVELAVYYVQCLLFFLCSYAATLLAVMLTGKMLTTVCAVGVFGCYLPLVLLLIYTFVQEFLTASFLADTFSFLDRGKLKYSSPWAFCVFWGNEETGRMGLTGPWPNMAGLCQLVAFTVLLSLAALAAYRHRRTEAAGEALAFGRMEGFIKIMLAVPAALVAALVGYIFSASVVWELGWIVLFGTLGCLIMEFIYRWDIRQVFMHKWHIAVTVLVAGAVFFGFRFDVLHYNTYLPGKEDIASIAVWEDENYEYPVDDGSGRKVPMDRKGILGWLESDRVDVLYGVAQDGVEHARRMAAGSYNYQELTTGLRVKYHLKNGKEIYRRYEVNHALYMKAMDELLEDASYKERYFPILTWSREDVYRIFGVYSEGEIPGMYVLDEDAEEQEEEVYYEADGDMEERILDLEVPRSRIGEVLEAYQNDLRRLSFTEIREAETDLNFQREDQRDTFRFDRYPFGGGFTETAELLLELAIEQA